MARRGQEGGTPPTRVLVADPVTLRADALGRELAVAPDLTLLLEADTRTAALALRAIHRHRPEVALIGHGYPRMTGPALIRAVATQRPEVRLVGLVPLGTPDLIQDVLIAGAAGVASDVGSPDAIAAVIRRVREDEGPIIGDGVHLPPDLHTRLGRRGAAGDHTATKLAELTARQLEVLHLFGLGWRAEEVALRLEISTSTVYTHATHIRTHLGVSSLGEALVLARRYGVYRAGR